MSAQRAPEITVVVPSYRRAERLPRLLAALEAQTLPPSAWELVIVDDCSGDDTGEVLRQLASASPLQLRVERTPRQSGPAPARNLGWRTASTAIVAFTDDDCVPAPNWLKSGLDLMRSDPTIGIAQGRTTPADLPPGRRPAFLDVSRDVPAPSPWFEGCNLFVRREALEHSGGFDEEIAWYCEETAMAWSILESGWRRGWAGGAVVTHDVEQRSLRLHLRDRYLEGHAAWVAARHPAFRDALWRRWSTGRRGAAFALALVGLAGSTIDRRAAWLIAPYLQQLYPLRRLRAPSASHLAEIPYWVAADTASLTGKLVFGLRHRAFLL